MHLVWISNRMNEGDWLRFLLGNLLAEETVVKPWPAPAPNTIYALDTNWLPLHQIPVDFLDAINAMPGVGLFHADEWFREDYNVYRYFSFVLRVHWRGRLQKPGIQTLPLGWPSAPAVAVTKAASHRPHSLFFAGSPVSSRTAMLAELRDIPQADLHLIEGQDNRLTAEQYHVGMRNTAFIPCPMGNVLAETWRFYEALEDGCIPIVERRAWMDYHRDLLGENPVPVFANWRRASRFISDILRRPEELDRLQTEILNWWSAKKQSLTACTRDFVARGAAGEFRADLKAFSYPRGAARAMLQYGDLLMHQSPASLRARAKRFIRRRP